MASLPLESVVDVKGTLVEASVKSCSQVKWEAGPIDMASSSRLHTHVVVVVVHCVVMCVTRCTAGEQASRNYCVFVVVNDSQLRMHKVLSIFDLNSSSAIRVFTITIYIICICWLYWIDCVWTAEALYSWDHVIGVVCLFSGIRLYSGLQYVDIVFHVRQIENISLHNRRSLTHDFEERWRHNTCTFFFVLMNDACCHDRAR